MSEGKELTDVREMQLEVLRVKNALVQVQELFEKTMVKDVDYGIIPGCGKKPSLWKPGAEKIQKMFRWKYSHNTETIELEGGHIIVKDKCTLINSSGEAIGDLTGTCSTMEDKYRYETARQKCPSCGAEAIFKSKQEMGGGFFCWQKHGGCNAKFKSDDRRITEQPAGRVETNPYDKRHTVTMMAQKRSFVGAVNCTSGASSIFTQDGPEFGDYVEPEKELNQAPGYTVDMDGIANEEPLPRDEFDAGMDLPPQSNEGDLNADDAEITNLVTVIANLPAHTKSKQLVELYGNLGANAEKYTPAQLNKGFGDLIKMMIERIGAAATPETAINMIDGFIDALVPPEREPGLITTTPKGGMRGVLKGLIDAAAKKHGVNRKEMAKARRAEPAMEQVGVLDRMKKEQQNDQ